MPEPTTADVLALFKRALFEVDRKELTDLDPSAAISSLGIDSVAMLEVIGFIEEELAVHLSDEKLATVETVGDLARVILEARAGG
jgi:acyl carrier protein